MGSYQRALDLEEKLNDAWSKAETLNQMSTIYIYLGQPKKAIECAAQALQSSAASGNKIGEARALNNLGDAYDWSGEKNQAIEFLGKALALWHTVKDKRLLANIYLNFGYSNSDLGNTQEAFDYYRRALSLWSETGHRRGEALTLNAMGRLNSRIGEKQEALGLYAQATSLFRRMGDRQWEATTLANSAYVYLGLGEPHQALSNYQEALKLNQEIDYNQGVAEVLGQIGEVYYSMGNFQKALDYYEQGLRLLRPLNLQRSESYALRNIGRAYSGLGEHQKALEYYQVARPLFQRGGDRQGEAYLLNDIGDVYTALKEQDRARNSYQEALTLNQKVGDRFGESNTRYHLALLEYHQTNLEAARALVEISLEFGESLRAKVTGRALRTSYSASIHQYYKLYLDVLMSLHRRRPELGYDALALAVSEKARARSLLELLAESRADLRRDVDPGLVEREHTLRQQLNGKAERLMRLRNGNAKDDEQERITQEVSVLSAQFDEVRALLRRRSPHYAALTQPQPLDLPAIQAALLDDNTLLLEYALGEQRSYVWAVTKNGAASYELSPRLEIEQAARRLNSLLVARQSTPNETLKERRARLAENDSQYAIAAAEMSRLVLGPVAQHLGDRRLIVVSEGALQYIPFAALPSPVETGEPLLVEHEIVNLPSASTLAVLRQETSQRPPATKSIIALADPVFGKDDARFAASTRFYNAGMQRAGKSDASVGADLPRMPATHDEAAAILSFTPPGSAKLVEGFAVNRALVMGAEMSQYRIIHFATHGLLDSQRPALSGIALSLIDRHGREQDGFLRMHDIYNLKLPAELVVLSACNTALGQDIKGEGLIALTRGFMYAGASRVIASLWKVEDDATADLMKEFYRQLFREHRSPAAALREAQLSIFRQGRAPYYWAAFVIQGEYNGSGRPR